MNAELIPPRAFFDTYSEAVLILSDKDQVIYVNPAFTHLTGFRIEQPFKMESLAALLKQQQFETGSLFKNHTTLAFTKKDGSLLNARVSESDLVLADGAKARVFTFVSLPGLDILPQGAAKFYELADASPAMIFLMDTNGSVFYFNKSWLNYTGIPLQEQLGHSWKKLIHPADAQVFEEHSAAITRKKSYSLELKLLKYDGTYRSIFIISTPIILEDGRFAGYMLSGLDITEIKESQAQISQLNHALKQSNEELEQFTYVTSHDLQEPLRMITGYIQLIQKNVERGNVSNLEEFMAYVLNGAARMQMLIADLLQLSRVTRKTVPFTAINIRDVLNAVTSHLSKNIQATDTVITYGDLPIVTGDTFQLVSLFENLLDNAVKFRKPGVAPNIHITAEEKDDKYIFSIKDNGIGIDNKFHKRIFAIFQRLHAPGEYEGTGIGLAVCKKIVERHSGEIWVESEPGNGSTFYFSIKK